MFTWELFTCPQNTNTHTTLCPRLLLLRGWFCTLVLEGGAGLRGRCSSLRARSWMVCFFSDLFLLVGSSCYSWVWFSSSMSLGLQVVGLVLGVVSWCLQSSCTSSQAWRVRSQAESVSSSQWQFEGLWMSCAATSLGSIQCNRFKTVLGLPGEDHTHRQTNKTMSHRSPTGITFRASSLYNIY